MQRVTIVEISPSLGSSIEPQGLAEEIYKQLKTILYNRANLNRGSAKGTAGIPIASQKFKR